MSSALKMWGLFVLFLIAAASVPALGALNFTRSTGQTLTQGFNVINSVWGTTNSPTDVAPGDIGVTLTITLQYVYSATAESIDAYLQLPSGFSLYNGSNVSFATVSGIYPTGAIIQLSFLMDLSSTLTLGMYPTSLELSWTAAGYSYLINDTVPVTIQVEGRPQLYFSYSGSGLEAGQLNEIPITISNNGTGSAANILVTSASQVGGVLNSIPEIQSLNAGSTVSKSLEVYVPASTSGSVLPLSMSATYKDSYGYTQSVVQPLNIYVQPSTSISNISVALIPKNITVMASQQSIVSFELVNTGNSTMYSPIITISVSSPLVIVANSTVTFNGAINPNDSLLFEATLTASPSSSLGTYSGTVSVKYDDQQGTQHSQSFNVGFILSASINLVVESETVTQSSRTLSVSGTLLNQGLASAYYAEIVGCVVQTTSGLSSNATATRTGVGRNFTIGGATTASSVTTVTTRTRNFTAPFPRLGSGFNGGSPAGAATLSTCPSTATSSYVGEIDPNSPVAFTASATYSPSNTSSAAVLVLVITYQNSFGTHATQPVDKGITLTAASVGTQSQIQTSRGDSSHFAVKVAFYAVIISVAVSAIVGGIFVRRGRKSPSTGEEKVV